MRIFPPFTSCLPLSLLQAAAAARIKGRPDIFFAAADGDIALVADHLTSDPTLAHARDSRLCTNLVPDIIILILRTYLVRRSETPLHFSAAGGHTHICNLLLQSAADVNAVSKR